MTSYGTWDGNPCGFCVEQSCYVDNGVDDERPCPRCGWFRGIFDGSRYPPGYCASSWRYATHRIRDLRGEFPDIAKDLVSKHVQDAGENDMDADIARNSLLAHSSSQRLCDDNLGLEYDDIFFVLSLIQDQKEEKREYRGEFVDDWTMDDMESIALKIAARMKAVREASVNGRCEESLDNEFISDVRGWSFNDDFDRDISGCVVDVVQALTGCFHCNKENPTKACSKCKLARYCNKKCQSLSWNDSEEPHKQKCGKFASARDESGHMVIVNLYTHCLLEGHRAFEMAMLQRTDPFLDEVARCSSAGWRESSARKLLNVEIYVQSAFSEGRAILSANTMFLDDKLQSRFDSHDNNAGVCVAHNILFKFIDSGYKQDYFQSRFESEGIIDGMKVHAIHHIASFLKKAKERDITVECITCSDGARWLHEGKWHRKLCLAAEGCRVRLHDMVRD